MAGKELIQADHIFMQNVFATTFSESGADPTRVDMDRISTVFSKAGGSWERLFLGSIRDINLLKRVVKIAVQNKHVHMKSS